MKNIKENLEEKKEYLNKLDSEIGDSDHGRGIAKAFKGAYEAVAETEEEDIGQILKLAARSIIASAGGASGALYGSGFLEAAKKAKGKKELNHEDIASILTAMKEGIMDRGGAELGDKTMVDTISPAAAAYNETADIIEGVNKSLEAAAEGRDSTEEMVSKTGRSSRLGERSKGHIDPGAASMYLVLEGLLTALAEDYQE